MNPGHELYGYWRSSATWRVRTALAYKGLPYELEVVDLQDDAAREGQRARNPMAQVPTLAVRDDDGKVHMLAQSLAIIEYLEERFPDPPLLPAGALARARARQLAEMVNSGTQPLQNSGVLIEVARIGGDADAWARNWIARGLNALAIAAAETAGTYLVGDAVSIADVYLVPQLYNARRYDVDLSGLELLTRVEARCLLLPAFQQAHADRQPDAAL